MAYQRCQPLAVPCWLELPAERAGPYTTSTAARAPQKPAQLGSYMDFGPLAVENTATYFCAFFERQVAIFALMPR